MKYDIIIPMAILGFFTMSCRREHCTAEPDLQYVRNLGYDFASRYREIDKHASEMTRQDFLLDVRSRENELRIQVGDIYAREFSKAFSDSAHVNIPQ